MNLMDKRALPLFKRIALTPLAATWSAVYFIRRAFYDYGIIINKSFQVPIISVGNLTFGGTGKTPFTLWLAQYLDKKNKKVMILSRGYRGKLEHSRGLIESDKAMTPDPSDFGDEALIFARRLDRAYIVVGKNRSENLVHYFPKIQPDAVLLDDGHQHLKIKRNLNIVLFDATMPLHKYFVAPLGYMREGFSALKDADLIVIGKADIAGHDKVEDLKMALKDYIPADLPVAQVGFKPNGFYNAEGDLVFRPEEIKDKKVIGLAGIGNPDAFYKSLEKMGADVLDRATFQDHHYFSKDELHQVIEKARSEQAYIVTTEKDMVRVRNIVNDKLIIYLEVDMYFLSGEQEACQVIDSCFKTNF